MKKIIAIVLLASLLQGCLAAGALAVGGVAGGAIASDRRSFQTMANDETIAHKATQQIAANSNLSKNAHIVVVSYNHVVLLAGQAPTQDLRAQAEQIVQGVPNVRRIFNEITIGKPTSPLRRSKDAAITANVKTRMMATTNVSASQIKVVTENGTVFLMGLTSRNQAYAAAQVARNSTGVQRVVKLIEYINV